jgi:tRNA threonylcarbamoyladenosine biosynthesis protein TsaB
MILSLRTDSPEAILRLLDAQGELVATDAWRADRALARDLHAHILKLLNDSGKSWEDLTGIVIFQGPGSFTGLRIGITVANALGYGLDIPVLGEAGENWETVALKRLAGGENDKVVLPRYGSEAHITKPRK